MKISLTREEALDMIRKAQESNSSEGKSFLRGMLHNSTPEKFVDTLLLRNDGSDDGYRCVKMFVDFMNTIAGK